MQRLTEFAKRYGIILPVVLVIALVIGGVTYLAGSIGTSVSNPSGQTLPLNITAVPPLPGTPIAPYAQINPEFADQLHYSFSDFGIDVPGGNIQSIGAYLPRTGNTHFEQVAPTPYPTPLPYPTSPPLPLPEIPGQPVPTVPVLTEDGTPRTLPYAGDSCAPVGRPVSGVLTQRYHAYHAGIDLGVPLGTPVLATHSAQVIYADWSDVGYGYLVILQNGPFITYYAHNLSFNVTVNQLVGKNSIIAWSGSTGNSSGPHVHYETRINDIPVDPLTFGSRGYRGC